MTREHGNSNNQKKWLKAIPIDIQSLYEKVDEPLPHSAKRWRWCWGGIVGLLFLLVAGTGLLLAMYYRAEPETAYNSVKYITEQARYGRFIRSVHQWGGKLYDCVSLSSHPPGICDWGLSGIPLGRLDGRGLSLKGLFWEWELPAILWFTSRLATGQSRLPRILRRVFRLWDPCSSTCLLQEMRLINLL